MLKQDSAQSDVARPALYLFGAMAKAHVQHIIRSQCIPEEIQNIDKIMTGWHHAVELFRNIESREQGIADNNYPFDLELTPKLMEIQNDALFRNSFSTYPSEFKMVEIDNLIAVQRHVSLAYTDMIGKRINTNASLDELINFCISPKQDVPTPRSLQNTENLITYSSPSVDFRFLGGFQKELTDDDLRYCLGGGLPVAAIVLFVGYGAGSINILRANNRLILNNGFHRVYALRKSGIKKIPVVVQNIGNPDLEMAPQILGLSRDYLLKHPRPVLVKDFFADGLTTTLRLKDTVRSVRVQWGFDQMDMAI